MHDHICISRFLFHSHDRQVGRPAIVACGDSEHQQTSSPISTHFHPKGAVDDGGAVSATVLIVLHKNHLGLRDDDLLGLTSMPLTSVCNLVMVITPGHFGGDACHEKSSKGESVGAEFDEGVVRQACWLEHSLFQCHTPVQRPMLLSDCLICISICCRKLLCW